jgi:hypothetical protein
MGNICGSVCDLFQSINPASDRKDLGEFREKKIFAG